MYDIRSVITTGCPSAAVPALALPAPDLSALAWEPFSMIEQNGHAITTVPAPVAVSCS